MCRLCKSSPPSEKFIKAFITVKRPKSILFISKKEYLIFKLKFCLFCNLIGDSVIDSGRNCIKSKATVLEKYKNIYNINSCRTSNYHHLNHSKGYVIIPFYDNIHRNEIASKHFGKKNLLTKQPKLSKLCKSHLSFKEFQPVVEEYLKSGLRRNETCNGDSSDECKVVKNFEKCKWNHCSRPATNKKDEIEGFHVEGYKCIDDDHFSRSCRHFKDISFAHGIKCYNKNKYQQIKCWFREKDKSSSGQIKKLLKTRDHGSCGDNMRNQKIYSPRKKFQDYHCYDSKLRKCVKLGLTNNNAKVIARKEIKNVLKSPKDYCKCSICSKRNRRMTKIHSSKKMKSKRVDLPPHVNESRFEKNGSKGMLWCATIVMMTIFLIIFAILIAFVSKKELNIPEIRTHSNRCLYNIFVGNKENKCLTTRKSSYD